MFLTGQEEIESAVRTIRDITRSAEENMAPLIVCPLYAALPSHAQLKVFKPTPRVCIKTHNSHVKRTNTKECKQISGRKVQCNLSVLGVVQSEIYL